MRRFTSPRRRLLVAALLIACFSVGCASTSNKWVAMRSTPRNPLSDTLGLLTRQGPKPTERTVQLLRRYDLEDSLKGDYAVLLAQLAEFDAREPNREHLYAMAELAYVGANRADHAKKCDKALELYGSAVLHSYRYLFDEKYSVASNPYDPEFRRACDLYNAALESTLRIVQSQEALRPGTSLSIKTATHQCQLDIQLKSDDWHAEDFDHFEFVSDYEVHGLQNHYHSYGLGVPLIAVRSKHEGMDPREQFYPQDLSFPVTAFLRVTPAANPNTPPQHATLELHDPLNKSAVQVAQANIPLETDLSAPLAHTLSQPSLDDSRLSTLGLLNPGQIKTLQGLYMLEPFQEDKIPVVMVHGLWSSPVTWMEMFNDLRSDPQIRQHYQFWFYLYPSGQPFWFSGAQMREDLAYMRKTLDPELQYAALDQTVLVGHSMGGLVSKLQTIDSGNSFWETLSEKPFAELEADQEIRAGLARTFFFDPNPSIRRIVTIGTPHRGSEFANDTTRWLGRKLIKIPSMIMQGRNQLIARNPGYFRDNAPLEVTTSIDSLAPESPLLPVLLTAQQGPWVKYHNIVGEVPKKGITGWLVGGTGDGVVTLASAQLDNVQSQIVVPADHISVHRHPQSILEVRRILMQHIAELRTFPNGGVELATRPAANRPATPPAGAAVAEDLQPVLTR
ncbi:MAG: alpha/beta fold hydrolase [Planctomycetales bacterium]|nr:alpha/beta fold hydrolase [Planctomycetales bacterium]